MSNLEKVDPFFPVALSPVHANWNTQSVQSDYQAVVRTDTGTVLGIHGPGYKLVTNKETFDAFDIALNDSHLALDNYSYKDALSYDGARAVRTYVFPNHILVVKIDDYINLRLQITNSYDGSSAFCVILSGYRLICTNGAVIGDSFMHSVSRHTKGFDISDLISRLQTSVDTYQSVGNKWRSWARRFITEDEVKDVLQHLPGINDKLSERLLELYHAEQGLTGPTVWAFYNALTSYSTHDPVRASNQANRSSIVLQRENRVRSLLNSDSFRRLAA